MIKMELYSLCDIYTCMPHVDYLLTNVSLQNLDFHLGPSKLFSVVYSSGFTNISLFSNAKPTPHELDNFPNYERVYL